MGQAKRRGTFEQRKAAAIKRGRDKGKEVQDRSKTERNKLITGAVAIETMIALLGRRHL